MQETFDSPKPKVATQGGGAQPPAPPNDGSYYDSGDMSEWRDFSQDDMIYGKKPLSDRMHHHRQQFEQTYGGRVPNKPRNTNDQGFGEIYPTGRAGDR
jgi:hypothetical protein